MDVKDNPLERKLSLESAKISGADTYEELKEMKMMDTDLKKYPPEDIDPSELEMDTEPEGYDFEARLKREAPAASNFLPAETNKRIIGNFYTIFKQFYELSDGDLLTSFAMTNLILHGSRFILNLIDYISKIDNTSFLFSQVGLHTMIQLYAPDEEYEDFMLRNKIRKELSSNTENVTTLLKSNPLSVALSNEYLDVNEETIIKLKQFVESFSLRGSTFSENFNSFIENGVVRFIPGLTSKSVLFSHNYRSNRSTNEGEPIYKLLDELNEPGNQESLKRLLEDEGNKQLMNSIFNLLTLFSLLQPSVRLKIINQLPITQSAADIRGSIMQYTSTGKPLKKTGNITYIDRIPGIYRINTDVFKYIMKTVPRGRLKEFKGILYGFLSEERTREDLDELVKEFTRMDIEKHEKDFSKIVKKQKMKKKAGKKKKKPILTKKQKKPSKGETKAQRSRRLRKQRESRRKKRKKIEKDSKKKNRTNRKKKDRVIKIGDSVEIHYN
jgi:hypothetical protein